MNKIDGQRAERDGINVSTEVTKDMVDRFLSWRLPNGFSPDCFITFDREGANRNSSWPIGTNIFTAEQAKDMLQHVLSGDFRYEKSLLSNAETELNGLRETAVKALHTFEYIFETTPIYREDGKDTISDKASAMATKVMKELSEKTGVTIPSLTPIDTATNRTAYLGDSK